ncbi:helix-turn-helix transcriptional regulator [Allokutzneria sp. A3M-2-11 16]|uniref:helix-turn-helix transcriptional regulator n=1 Tax=Allokutzneria sp. A3M-2-11 16 TaxID=2962043 RepID=UPI0020B8C050|nr:helix-turn-helix transcriptional regulator [Allokutzneria sp. A3M-2-11 16]MCP3803323.1 helix-turn-helix transcriptional regulator [Allokutzneria sp. A3M-2-11 16]
MLAELDRPDPAETGPDPHDLWAAAAAELSTRVSFDSLCVGSTDPASGLIDTARVAGLPESCLRAAVRAEYGAPDFNKLDWLARQRHPVGLLSSATNGALERSHRYRTILRPLGLRHELRVALVSRGSCWGYLVLCRAEGTPDFSAAEITHVRGVAARLTDQLVCRVRTIPVGGLQAERAGVISLDADGVVDAIDDTARDLLDRSGAQRCDEIPLVLATFAAKLTGGDHGDRRALLPDPTLGWLLLNGSVLRTRTGADRLTVSIQPAPPLRVAPYLLYARGATPRSVAVTLRVLRGMTSAEIAEDLRISRHTVQDHLKPVFSALSVNSRRELISSLFPSIKPHELH